MRQFAEAVRARDYEGARALCDRAVVGFGTVSDRYTSLEELATEQWEVVWARTEGFEFGLEGATYWHDGSSIVVASEWSSYGVESGGQKRQRSGRATLVLAEEGNRVHALHMHFSMVPGTPA